MCDICVFFVLKSTTLQFYYPINHVLLFFTLTLFIIDSRIRILLTLCIIILSYNPNPNPTNATVFEGDISLSLTRYKEEDNINYFSVEVVVICIHHLSQHYVHIILKWHILWQHGTRT